MDRGSTPEARRLLREEEQLLSNESRTPSKVWKSMAKFLRRDANQSTPPPSVLTADGFLKFFSEKVESVRCAMSDHRPPEILFAAVASLLIDIILSHV